MTITCALRTPRVGNSRLRLSLLCLSLLLTACVTRNNGQSRIGEDVAIQLASRIIEGRPVLDVEITNTSPRPICLRVEAIENPYSYEMDIRLRDMRGNNIPVNPSGFVSPPRSGITRIEPGSSASGQYYLDARFGLSEDGQSRMAEMRAQVGFSYGYCDDVWSLRSRSDWQFISAVQ